MKKFERNLIWKALALFMLLSAHVMTGDALGQKCGAEQVAGKTVTIDAKTRRAVIDSVANAIEEKYIYPERTREIIAILKGNLESGTYDTRRGGDDLAETLTSDLRKITGDLHFGVSIVPNDPSQAAPSCNAVISSPDLAKDINFGFKTVKHLAGNVGYLEMTMFVNVPYSRATAEAAMQFLAGVDALIIDLRPAVGGSTSIGQLLAGYLMKPNTELHTRRSGREGLPTVIRVIEPSNAEPRLDLPVFILTGPLTASAAEALAYDLKHLGRATIVGEKTMGAGHCADMVSFEFPEFSLELMIPVEEPINPVTKRGWEGVGVVPDIEVTAGDALAEAHKQALLYLASRVEDAGKRRALEWASMAVKAQHGAPALSPDKLAEYAGTYGPRLITIKEKGLIYQREGFPVEHRLVQIDDDLFALEDSDIMRLRFDRDETGVIKGITGLYDRGHQDSHPKDS